VCGIEAEEERGADGDAGGVGGRGEAAEGESGAVDSEGEGGVVAGDEGVGGVDEEGDDSGGDIADGGELLGSAAADIGYAQRQRVLADQELENDGVAVVQSSEVKGRHVPLIGDSH